MKIAHGNIVEHAKTGIILQQVNCQGVMGSGVAAAIRGKWPQVFTEYKQFCEQKIGRLGRAHDLLGQVNITQVEPRLHVANLFGQEFFGNTGERFTSYDALDFALGRLAKSILDLGLDSEDVHHPLIGCGLGGGEWKIVAAIIDKHFGPNTTLWMYP